MNKKLIDLVQYANEHSRYYNSLFEQNGIDCDHLDSVIFNKIPIMKKSDYKNNIHNIIIDEYQNNHIKFLNKIPTSGSSGIPLIVYFEPTEHIVSNLNLWRLRKKWYDITPLDKMCGFSSDISNNGIVMDWQDVFIRDNNMFFSKIRIDNDHLELYYNKIHDFLPKWLYIQPSIMLRLYLYMQDNGLSLPHTVKYIELVGETVSPHFVSQLKEAYNNVNISVMYGAKEFNAIAYMCPHGIMHVLEDNVYIETNNLNEAIITGLVNSKAPIIRYNLEDKIKLRTNYSCDCGISGTVIDEIVGRSSNVQYIDNCVTADALTLIVDKINYLYSNCICEYRICELTTERINIGVYLDNSYLPWEKTIVKEIKQQLLDFISSGKTIYISILNYNTISQNSGKMIY